MPAEVSNVSLDVLQNDGSVYGSTWNLHVSSWRQALNRSPVIVPVPSNGANANPFQNRPQAWALDLGLLQEVFTIEGFCNDEEPDLTHYPTITLLQEVGRIAGIHISSTVTANSGQTNIVSGGGVALHIDPGPNQGGPWRIKGFIQSFNSTREGGNLYISWTMGINVTEWPVSMGGS